MTKQARGETENLQEIARIQTQGNRYAFLLKAANNRILKQIAKQK